MIDAELTIKRIDNGYMIDSFDTFTIGIIHRVIEDDDVDPLITGQRLLLAVMKYFDLVGNENDKRKLTATIWETKKGKCRPVSFDECMDELTVHHDV